MPKTKNLIVIPLLLLFILACNAVTPSTTESIPTPVIENIPSPIAGKIPLTEADVPRVTLEDAKAAFDNGEAVIVDVRSSEFYSAGHITGAINIPLTEIEANPAKIDLPKDQWTITYCT